MELLDESKKPLFRIRLVAETDQTATYWKISALGESKRTTAMPTMAVSLNGSPLCKYEETSATSTAELFAAVQGYANETATSVDQLISNAMAALLSRKVLRDDDDGALEKFCVMYLILSEPVPSPEGVNYTGTIAEWLPAFDFTVNILGHEDGFVLRITKDGINRQS
jgi:hypothetical protein